MNVDLAKRLAAQSWWEWRSGMRAVSTISDGFAIHMGDMSKFRGIGPWHEFNSIIIEDAVPDLDDAATAGALQGMFMESLGDAPLETDTQGGTYNVHWHKDGTPWQLASGATSGEAYAEALLALKGEK